MEPLPASYRYDSAVRLTSRYQRFPTLCSIGPRGGRFQNGVMENKRRALTQVIRTTILLVAAAAATLANEGPAFRSEPATPLCYCHCPYESGMKHCTKMCELPQYQKRWWAISCAKKKNSDQSKSSSPATAPGSKKTNRHEQA
jgi:hypothetical protein